MNKQDNEIILETLKEQKEPVLRRDLQIMTGLLE